MVLILLARQEFDGDQRVLQPLTFQKLKVGRKSNGSSGRWGGSAAAAESSSILRTKGGGQ